MLRDENATVSRHEPPPQEPNPAGIGALAHLKSAVPAASLLVALVALTYTAIGGQASTILLAVLAVLAVAGSWWRAASPALYAGAAAIAASWTSPEAFSLWPVAVGMAVLSAYRSRSPVPWPVIVAGVLVTLTTAIRAEPAPLLPVAVAAVLILGGAAWSNVEQRFTDYRGEMASVREQADADRARALMLQERTILARDLHDVVGHHVTAMVLQAEAGLSSDPNSALTKIADLGRAALDELETLVFELREVDHDTGPGRIDGIGRHLVPPVQAAGIQVDLNIPIARAIPSDLQLVVYRIVQESLTNVVRHAAATRVEVTVHDLDDELTVSIHDDGIGLPDHPTRGSGLRGIAERVAAAGGQLNLRTDPSGGTTVEARFP